MADCSTPGEASCIKIAMRRESPGNFVGRNPRTTNVSAHKYARKER